MANEVLPCAKIDRGKTTQLADRTITLVMQCDQDAHIRVQLNTANISNNGFDLARMVH